MSQTGIWLWVDGVPVPKGSTRSFVNPKTGRVVTLADAKGIKPWSSILAWSARSAMGSAKPYEGPLFVALAFHLPRPKTVKRSLPIVKPDLDKLERAVLDPLTGIVWIDDAQVVRLQSSKCYAGKLGPGVDITVRTDLWKGGPG